MKPKFRQAPDVISIEINELNIRYKFRIINNKTGLKSFILISFFEKYTKIKHKLNKTILSNEIPEPKIIEMGKIENNIIGMFDFMFSTFFI